MDTLVTFHHISSIYCDKYLKSLSDKFLTNASRLQFIDCILSVKTKLSIIVKAVYFSNPFGITFTLTSNLPISWMINACHIL